MTVGEPSKNLPWVEKYRPSKLEDLVSHDEIVRTINQFMQENQMPHLLFYGPPGTGKTSTILACARQMYTPQQFNSMVLELNASDDRGIGIVRGQILSFASTRTIFKAGPKLIILDEADAMTNDAQNALRRNSEDEDVQSRTVKITVVGEPATGKTSLCTRYLGAGSSARSTQGAEVMAGQCLGLRPPVPLQLCDVAGNALATAMLSNYLYASDVVVFVYDLTNLQSFEKLRTWFDTVKRIFEPEPKKPIMALFGNKSDLEHQRAVRLSVVQKFASEHLLENFKGSARTGETVSSVVSYASEHLLENFKGSARTGETVNSAFTHLVARVLGGSVRLQPAATNGRSPMPRPPRENDVVNGHAPTAQTLIMNRKALRQLQRKANSSVCSVQ